MGFLGPLVFAIILNIVGQIFLVRVLRQRLIASCAAGFLIGLLGLIASHLFLAQSLEWFCLNLAVFVNFGYLYFQFFSIGENSVRIRLLFEINNAPEGIIKSKLEDLYSWESILNARIDRLKSSGQIRPHGKKYVLGKSKLIYFAKLFALLKWIYFGRTAPK